MTRMSKVVNNYIVLNNMNHMMKRQNSFGNQSILERFSQESRDALLQLPNPKYHSKLKIAHHV